MPTESKVAFARSQSVCAGGCQTAPCRLSYNRLTQLGAEYGSILIISDELPREVSESRLTYYFQGITPAWKHGFCGHTYSVTVLRNSW
jgi:hypothetical protein